MLYFAVPFCSIFVLVGGWLTFSAARKIALGIQAQKWPHAVATILSVQNKDTSDSESSSREIIVDYSYKVGGQEYHGRTIHPTYTSSSLDQVHQALETALRQHKQVRVYYDPNAPQVCTLSVGFYSGSLVMVSAGFLFFAAGLCFLFTFWFLAVGDWDLIRGITFID